MRNTLRSNLLILALGSLLPFVLLTFFAVSLLIQHERQTTEREAMGRVRSILSAVDASVQGSIAAAQALAASENLEKGDIRAFHEESQRVLHRQPHWLNIGLASVSGKQLSDAVLPFGQEAHDIGDRESLERVLRTSKPAFGAVAVGPAIGSLAVRIRIPVIQQGELRYVLSVPLKLEPFVELLRAQGFPAGWVTGVLDQNNRFIARIPSVTPGTSPSETFSAALERSPEGWFRGRNLEGREIYTAYATSPLSGWRVGFAIPVEELEAAERRALTTVVFGFLVALAIAAGLAWLVDRRIAQPMSALAQAAADLKQGRPVDMTGVARIQEIDAVGQAFHAAHAAMKERQDLLEREKNALAAADRAKDEFIAMLSHELRNPLTALTSASQLLNKAHQDHAVSTKAREIIERQTRHMTHLIEDLLDVSRVAMGKAIITREPMNLAEAVSSAVDSMKSAGRFARHELVLDLDSAWVHADRSRIEQILTNLLDNALKFTGPGKRIEVKVTRDDQDAIVRVADDGEGIDLELRDHVFDLFVQGQRGLDRAKGGLGVGLALVRRLTEMHGGNVSVESEGIGHGAVFTVRLPAISGPSGPVQVTAERRSQPRGGRRIVVIEDNDDVRETLRTSLAMSGHLVHEARDGESGLELAATVRPEVAFIDIGLPGIDGYEVARRLRASSQPCPLLIAISGYGQPEDVRRALEAGFDAHFTKPLTAERLEDAMASVH